MKSLSASAANPDATPSDAPRPSRVSLGKRYARATLEAWWFGLVPAVLAALAYWHLIPSSLEVTGIVTWYLFRLTLAPVVTLVASFLLFSLLLRYWQKYLPGARWLQRAPSESDPLSLASTLRLALTLAIAALATLAVRNAVFQPYTVLSASMLPTLEPHDWIGVDKLAYGWRGFGATRANARMPARGDVVAFHRPESARDDQPELLVKRVIGLPGDVITFHNTRPVINGWPVPDCDVGVYTRISTEDVTYGRLVMEFLGDQAYLTVYIPEPPRFDKYVVKRGEVFLLGDNRNNSQDSRSWNNGFGGGLPFNAIEGRARSVLLSFKRSGMIHWRESLRPLGQRLHLDGVDVSELQAGIAHCLANPPRETLPPGPNSVSL